MFQVKKIAENLNPAKIIVVQVAAQLIRRHDCNRIDVHSSRNINNSMSSGNASSTLGQSKLDKIASPVEAILVAQPQATPQPCSAKKRGRPKLSDISEVICWTGVMIEALLNARKANLSAFLVAKDKKAIIRGWSRVALTFNASTKLGLSIEKIKS